jgi:hypothetical protein
VSGWVDGNQRVLVTIAASGEVRNGSMPKMRALIARQIVAQPEWDDLFVTDTHGTIIAPPPCPKGQGYPIKPGEPGYGAKRASACLIS